MPHGIPSVFPLQAIIGHTGEDPISMKKLLECEGTSEAEKEAFGWLINAIVWSIGGKCRNRQLPQNTMFIGKPMEHTDENETGNKRFYSFAQSRGLRSIVSEDLRPSQVNRLDELGTEEFPDVPLRVSFKPNENTRIDELTNEVKDLREQVGLVLQKLDKMADSEGHL